MMRLVYPICCGLDVHPKVLLNDANVFAYLEAQGYDTSLLVKCNDN